MQDRNFDDIAEKFSRNIYGTTKGQLRQAILWQDLDRVLAEMGPQKLRVLDAGGGEGQTAIKMAERRYFRNHHHDHHCPIRRRRPVWRGWRQRAFRNATDRHH